MTRRDESRTLLLTLVAALSLLTHVPALMALAHLFPQTAETLEDLAQIDEIDLVDDPEEEEEEKEEPQIVSLDKPKDETEAPEDARFVDRYNQKVDADRQTVRKRDGLAVGQPAPAEPNPRQAAQGDPAADPKDRRDEARTQDPKQANPDTPDGVEARDDKPDNAEREDSAEATPPGAEQGGPDVEASDILPNFNNAKGEGGDGRIQDYLDVEEGDKDLLNRKRVRYWAYFDRMKTAVSQHWRPSETYRLHDPRRQIYGVEDRMTIISVVLNGDGSVSKLHVEKPSGAPFLDDEAVRAFRAAAAFPNPPEAIKDRNGQISLRFGFYLNIQTSGSRIIRFRQ